MSGSSNLPTGVAAGSYDCTTTLETLYDVIMKRMTAGRHVSKFRHEDQELEYQKVATDELLSFYKLFYRECGASSGLPDLSCQQVRGAPASIRIG